jgi:SAM-dependent methyltransferase
MGPVCTCRICGGELVLRIRGGATAAHPADLAPTNHAPGRHAGFYRCGECGAVQQTGAADAAAYVAVADPGYVAEEAGRRATAKRVLQALGPYRQDGRLLDVGCGHGFLVHEASAQGFDAFGIEPSLDAATYARDVLGVDVRSTTLEALPPDEQFDVVVLTDVLEHIADPVEALRKCARLVAPGGVLCVGTPDPTAAIARLFGRRWWSYIPGHAVLLPRRTLHELLAGLGLVVSTDTALARTFTLGYWLAGLRERSGPASAVLRLSSRILPRRRLVSLALGDDRLVLAHRVERQRPAVPLVSARGAGASVHIVLPAYRAARTLPQVADELPDGAADRALVVDDASPDDTTEVAMAAGFEVVRHPRNRGYGANQKTCYSRALLDGADVIVMVHADNQYDPALVPEMVAPILAGEADAVIGSRLLDDRAVAGGMPRWKWVGNKFLTYLENRAFRRRFSEYHTGYRAFSADLLRSIPFLRNSDSFVFDQEIFAQMIARDARIREVPIPTRYFLEASSVSFRSSVAYGLRTLVVLARYRLDRRWKSPLLRRPAAELLPEREAEPAAALSSSGSG